MVVDKSARKHQLATPLIGANDISVSNGRHGHRQHDIDNLWSEDDEDAPELPVSFNLRKYRRVQVEEAFFRGHGRSSSIVSLQDSSDVASVSADVSGSDLDSGSQRRSGDFREIAGAAQRYFSGMNDSRIVVEKLFPPWVASGQLDGLAARPDNQDFGDGNDVSKYLDSPDYPHIGSPEVSPELEVDHDLYDDVFMAKSSPDNVNQFTSSYRKLSSPKGASPAMQNFPIESVGNNIWLESAGSVDVKETSDEEFDRGINLQADQSCNAATLNGSTVVRHPSLVEDYGNKGRTNSGAPFDSPNVLRSPVSLESQQLRWSMPRKNITHEEKRRPKFIGSREGDIIETRAQCFTRPSPIAPGNLTMLRNMGSVDNLSSTLESPDVEEFRPKSNFRRYENKPKARNRTPEDRIRRFPSTTVNGTKNRKKLDRASKPRDGHGADNGVITHNDLLSFLSVDQSRKQEKGQLSQQTARNEIHGPTCISAPADNLRKKTFANIIRGLQIHEEECASELETLITDVIPTIASRGNLQANSSGRKIEHRAIDGRGDDDVGFVNWIYKIGKCLQKIQSIHHHFPLFLDNYDNQTGLQSLCSWATQALVHYASYLQLYRTPYFQMAINLSKPSSSEIERLSTFVAFGSEAESLQNESLPQNKDGDFIDEANHHGRLLHETKETFNQIACLTSSGRVYEVANDYDSLSRDANKPIFEAEAKTEDDAPFFLGFSGVRGMEDLGPLKNQNSNLVINQRTKIRARESFWLVFENNRGKRTECECVLLLREGPLPIVNHTQGQNRDTDLLICGADHENRECLMFPPIGTKRDSVRRGTHKGEILIIVRSPINETEKWCKTLRLYSKDDKTATEWVSMINACSNVGRFTYANTPVETPLPTPPPSPEELRGPLIPECLPPTSFIRYRVSLHTWATVGSWKPLSSKEVDAIVTPGLIELYDFLLNRSFKSNDYQETCHRAQSPLLAWELTPKSSIRRGTVLDIIIRSTPLAQSRKTTMSSISPNNNVMLRSRTPDDCEKLFERIESCRIQSNESRPVDTPASLTKRPMNSSPTDKGKTNNNTNAHPSEGSTNPTQSGRESYSPSNMAQAALFFLRKLSRVKSKAISDSSEQSPTRIEQDSEPTTSPPPPFSGLPILDSCRDKNPSVSSPQATALPPSNGGLTHAMVRLHKRMNHTKWLSMGSARLIIAPYFNNSSQTSTSPRKDSSCKRVLLISRSGQALLDASLGENCFERVSQKGIALSIRKDRSNKDGGIPKDGGVIGGGFSVYMLEMKDQVEAGRIFGLLSRMRY